MWSSTIFIFIFLSIFVDKTQPEMPQLFDYLNGFYLDCYECHSNRPGCGEKLDWILMRWKRCIAPGGSKCVKIIERSPDGEINYIRGCINQIEALRPEMPTVRENGCWAASDKYIVSYRPWYVQTDEPVYCFCDERDGCNTAVRSLINCDPSGHDPVECATLLAERSVTLYTIGCEPTATPYRDFFMALAFKTGGQYIPLANCGDLAAIIVGSAKEEISLERLIAQVHEEVMHEAVLRGGSVDETELTRRIHEVMQGGGAKARRLKMNNHDGTTSIPAITPNAEYLSTLGTLKEIGIKWIYKTKTIATPVVPVLEGLFGCDTKFATTSLPTPPAVKLVKIKTKIPNINLKDDELLDISQTRRFVRKCVARNKLKST
ncbi:unnamed protein product [Rotaria sp. Silwood2]|nr:unnamed protein product [Rotaria sp. Silwood2]